jgi:methylthioribose-1-phosphate isomerase
MKIDGRPYRTIWLSSSDPVTVSVIDQRRLPHELVIEEVRDAAGMARAIRDMHVRGAGLIGAAAAYGMYLAAANAPRDSMPELDGAVRSAAAELKAARPTAVNLEWAVARQLMVLRCSVPGNDAEAVVESLRREAAEIAAEDVRFCRAIGEHGCKLIAALSRGRGREPVNVLTHCNAGWLACVDYGTATAPVYAAHAAGMKIHVWVDETRPRNQGARLTAWELLQQGVPHTVIADNTGGHLMQHGLVDMVIVGSDRTTRCGDVANKIGTYLKALAARDNGIPFYVALQSSAIDWNCRDGLVEIPIEERGAEEVKRIRGLGPNGICDVLITPEASPAANYAFDVTPARLVTGLITERGVCGASESGLLSLFPERSETT